MRKCISTCCAAAIFTQLTGCCVSYHTVAKLERDVINRPVDRSSLVTLVGSALNSVGHAEIAKRSADGKEASPS